jgi:hypothetical protein
MLRLILVINSEPAVRSRRLLTPGLSLCFHLHVSLQRLLTSFSVSFGTTLHRCRK